MNDNLLESFIQHLRVERGLAERTTVKSYGYQVGAYLRFLRSRGRAAATATRDDVLAYLETKRTAGQRSSSLFNTAIAVRQFHRFLAAAGHASVDPTAGMRLPKFSQRLPEPFSVEEMERLLDVPTGSKVHRIRLACALQLMWSVAGRVSEIVGLRLDQVDLKGGWVRLEGKGSRDRYTPLGPKTQDALRRYLECRNGRRGSESGLLFFTNRGRPWTRGAFWWQLKQLAKDAGVGGRVFPHRVRHSTISHLLWAGLDLKTLQELAGHRSGKSTFIYAHVMPEHVKRACQSAHPRF